MTRSRRRSWDRRSRDVDGPDRRAQVEEGETVGATPNGVEGFDFEEGIDEGDLSPTTKTKIKRGRATPPRHKLPILFF